MQKIAFILLIITSTFILSSCGSNKQVPLEQGTLTPLEVEEILSDLDRRLEVLENSNPESITEALAQLETNQMLLVERVDNLKQDIDELKQKIVVAEEKVAYEPPTSTHITSFPVRVIKPVTGNLQRDYDEALSLHRNLKKHKTSIEKFSTILANYKFTNLTDNCHYWIGESRFQLSEYNEALAAFSEVLSIQDCNKRADALVMTGRCYQQLDRKQEAKNHYEQLVKEFPKHEKITFVKSQLRNM